MYQDYNQLFIHINLVKLCSKLLFLFDGRIRRIEYFLSGIIGGIVFGIAYSLGLATLFLGAAAGSAGGSVFGILIGFVAGIASCGFLWHRALSVARLEQIRLADSDLLCSYHWLGIRPLYVVCRWYGRS